MRAQPSVPLEERPFVTCKLRGQLGNQLFQIAATLAYAWDYDAIPLFPDLESSQFRIPLNKNALFFRLNSSQLPRPILNIYKEPFWYCSERIPFQIDQQLEGFFISWKHFHHYRNKIVSIFSPSKSMLEYLYKKYAYLIVDPKTVSIHVRTFNPRLSPAFAFVGLDYYENAMKKFPNDTVFVVFSDRINWCKQHFTKFDKNFVFIENNNHVQDFFLMSMMKHNIIGNSTYSWWAAYLNENPDKVVIMPDQWRCAKIKFLPSDSIVVPGWQTVPVNENEPYPFDITHYDAITQSLDGN